jgi:hypothetical protein
MTEYPGEGRPQPPVIKHDNRKWDTQLQKIACVIRTSVHESSKLTTYFINFGREICLNVEADRTSDNFGAVVARDEAQIAAGAVGFLAMYRDFRKRLDKAYQQSRKRYNLRRCDVRYIAGQEVWWKNYPRSSASAYYIAKWAPRF